MATLQLAVCGVPFLAVARLTGGLTVRHAAVAWRAIAVASVGWLGVALMLGRSPTSRTDRGLNGRAAGPCHQRNYDEREPAFQMD